jgi:osmotically-inducible protein OsmY
MKTTTTRTLMLPAMGILVASMALAGCNRRDDTTAGAPANDSVAAQTEQRAKDMQSDAGRSMADAKENAKEAAQDIKTATSDAAARAGDKVADAVITTTVNAELAKDKSLSATKIDVDTDAGRVALRGTAPDEASRERATQLAMAVKGVVNVDNQLKVDNKM